MKEEEAKETLKKARIRLIGEDCPFWGILCMGMDLIEDTTERKALGTMSTDGKSIFWSKSYVETLTVPELEYVLGHESGGHKGLLHHIRLRELIEKYGKIDMRTANIAADQSITHILEDAHIGKAPEGIIKPDPRFADKSFEQIYKILMEEKESQQSQQDQKEEKKEEEKEEEKSQRGSQTEQLKDTKKSQEEGTEEEKIEGEEGEIGDDPGRCGGVLPAPESNNLKEKEEKAKEDIRNAFEVSKKAGNVPEGLRKMVEELLRPKTDWRGILREHAEEKVKKDFDWKRPNRRYIPYSIYFPDMGGRELGDVVILSDRSGSVNYEQEKELLTESLSILDEFPEAKLSFIFFATHASHPYEITCLEDIKAIQETNLGYGTDYKPPFQVMEEENMNPKVTIVLTDGYCSSFPSKAWEGDVIWLINNHDPFNPPFGEVVRMDE